MLIIDYTEIVVKVEAMEHKRKNNHTISCNTCVISMDVTHYRHESNQYVSQFFAPILNILYRDSFDQYVMYNHTVDCEINCLMSPLFN